MNTIENQCLTEIKQIKFQLEKAGYDNDTVEMKLSILLDKNIGRKDYDKLSLRNSIIREIGVVLKRDLKPYKVVNMLAAITELSPNYVVQITNTLDSSKFFKAPIRL